jgi:Family of unknown function (DUF6496)
MARRFSVAEDLSVSAGAARAGEERFGDERVCWSSGFLLQEIGPVEEQMVKRRRKYSPSVSKDVAREMRAFERGTARSGRGGKGGKVKSRKQAIAIALSEARKEGKRVPKKSA